MPTLQEIETPKVIVDYKRLVANIRHVQEKADANRLNLRPHVKTHKSLEIARLQLEPALVASGAQKRRRRLFS